MAIAIEVSILLISSAGYQFISRDWNPLSSDQPLHCFIVIVSNIYLVLLNIVAVEKLFPQLVFRLGVPKPGIDPTNVVVERLEPKVA